MESVRVAIERLGGSEDLPLPRYMTEHAAGMDIVAAVEAQIVIAPGERALVPTGIAIALPEGYEAQIRPQERPGPEKRGDAREHAGHDRRRLPR